MSTRFLAQLAHRALAGSDVRPRTPARFESPAALEQTVERAAESPTAPESPAPVAPPRASAYTERAARLPDPPIHERPPPVARTVTREDIVERVIHRDVPVLLEAPARVPPAPPVREAPLVAHMPEHLSQTPSGKPREMPAPLLARTEPAAPPVVPVLVAPAVAPAPARVAAREPSQTAILAAPILPAPAAPPVSTRAAPEPAPAPIEIVIGRIEIRSDPVAEPPSQKARSSPARRRPAMSLETYLRGRGERTR